jgi:hypothetical protein
MASQNSSQTILEDVIKQARETLEKLQEASDKLNKVSSIVERLVKEVRSLEGELEWYRQELDALLRAIANEDVDRLVKKTIELAREYLIRIGKAKKLCETCSYAGYFTEVFEVELLGRRVAFMIEHDIGMPVKILETEKDVRENIDPAEADKVINLLRERGLLKD